MDTFCGPDAALQKLLIVHELIFCKSVMKFQQKEDSTMKL